MFKEYNTQIKKLLSSGSQNPDWEKTLESHRLMLSRIRDERLIHLLVTIFVGIIMALASFLIILTGNLPLLWLAVPLLILFIAYLFHYRFLENTTQNWYQLEDQIAERF